LYFIKSECLHTHSETDKRAAHTRTYTVKKHPNIQINTHDLCLRPALVSLHHLSLVLFCEERGWAQSSARYLYTSSRRLSVEFSHTFIRLSYVSHPQRPHLSTWTLTSCQHLRTTNGNCWFFCCCCCCLFVCCSVFICLFFGGCCFCLFCWWGVVVVVVVVWDGGWELRPVKHDGYMTANLRTKKGNIFLTPTRT